MKRGTSQKQADDSKKVADFCLNTATNETKTYRKNSNNTTYNIKTTNDNEDTTTTLLNTHCLLFISTRLYP